MKFKRYFTITVVIVIILIGIVVFMQLRPPSKPSQKPSKPAPSQNVPPAEELSSVQLLKGKLEPISEEDEPVRVHEMISFCERLGKNKKQIQGCKDNYYYRSAVAGEDKELCLKIKDQDLKTQCKKEVKGLAAAEPREEEKVCGTIKDQEVKSVCESLHNMRASKELRMPTKSECKGLSDESAREICLSVIRNQENLTLPVTDDVQLVCGDIKKQKIQNLCFKLFKSLE